MKRESLGTGTLSSSRLAYGCWRIAGCWEPASRTPDLEANGRRAVIAAYEAGFTLFDHADVYCSGWGEIIFGQVLKEISSMREQVVIASKCGIRRAGEPDPTSPYRYDFSAQHIIWSCEQSLKRLGVESIDLYQLHRPDFLGDPDEVASAFSELKKQGKILEFGLSNFTPSQVALLQKACPMPFVVNQVQISLLKLDPFTDGTIDHCMAEKITPMAWSPLAQGKLGTAAPNIPKQAQQAGRLDLLGTLDSIAEARGVSRSVIALAWLLKHPSKIIPIIGSTNPHHIRDAAQAVEVDLTREEWYRLLESAWGQRLP
jgi:predicted oxidoreductase